MYEWNYATVKVSCVWAMGHRPLSKFVSLPARYAS